MELTHTLLYIYENKIAKSNGILYKIKTLLIEKH